MKSISILTAPGSLAVFKIPAKKPAEMIGLTLALDQVRDPGNLGTIIRLCDWFDVKTLLCAPGTADCYNPKVVQATMGSLCRVNIIYTDLEPYLKKYTSYLLVMGVGAYITKALLKMPFGHGHESKGIGKDLMRLSPIK